MRGVFMNLSTGYNLVNPNLIAMEQNLNAEDKARLAQYRNNWNFFDGYHYEGIEVGDKPEVTENWCRRFVTKFVATEFNDGISFKFDKEVEDKVLPFLNEVWEDNQKDVLLQSVGQMKSVTGDAYIHVHFEPKEIDGAVNPDFDDPFDLYEKGRIRLFSVPSSIVFPKYKDGYDSGYEAMESCTIMYPVKIPNTLSSSESMRYRIVKYVYTKEAIEYYEGKELIAREKNKYGVIPIVHLRNLNLSGRLFGLSDLEDIIPLNVELNLKNSDVSEVLDYYSAPVTCIYGARIGQLEKGANKVWGGLPKDAKVENIELKGDLAASSDYREYLKQSIHDVGNMPRLAIGGGDIPANISGSALHVLFMPLVDVTNLKRQSTGESLEIVNKIIIKMGLMEQLITKPEGVANKLIFNHKINFGNILPKDSLQEMEQIERELKAGIESRRSAMLRMKKENIEEAITEIDKERKEHPKIHGIEPVMLSAGQKLVNPETGEVIADNPAPEPMITGEEGKTGQPEKKVVGQNKSGDDLKLNSGAQNKNPGKKE